jgi:8-oxo-dGTP diphosphatase
VGKHAGAMLMYRYKYPRPAVIVDIVVFTIIEEHLQVLLIERVNPPFQGEWALPGGFINMEEPLEQAAYRELSEETGIIDVYLEQLHTYGQPDRDPRGRVISVAYYALTPSDNATKIKSGSDASNAIWFQIEKLPELAFDHRDIINYALMSLRYKLEYTAFAFELLSENFTLTELQKIYEIILGIELDKRNFCRRMLIHGIIEPTPHSRNNANQSARLYHFRPDAVAEIKAKWLFPRESKYTINR